MTGSGNGRRWPDVNEYVEAYESAQARDGGAELDDFAPPPGHPERLAILCELVRVDLEYHWERGRPRLLEHYRDCFPDLFKGPELRARAMRRSRSPQTATFRLHGRANARAPADHRAPVRRRGRRLAAVFGALPAVEASAGMEGAASVYRTIVREVRVGSTPDELGSAAREPRRPPRARRCFRARPSSRTDPHAAERLADALASLPPVGGRFLGFRLCAELGRGAFGRVYLARQGDLADRLVALKVSADVAGETHALAQLQHTNIVPIYSVHRRGPLQAVCMPYLGETTLADTLADLKSQARMPDSGAGLLSSLHTRKGRTGGSSDVPDDATADSVPSGPGPAGSEVARTLAGSPLTSRTNPQAERLRGLGYVPAVLCLMERVADGLAHAHERGILHRDLKPANILFADDGEPLLLDFNLAADTKLRVHASAALVGGTLPYMAPEHLEAFRDGDATVDARSDVYSLGVILFELLTGRHPFPFRRGMVDEVLPAMIADRLGPVADARRANPSVTPAVASIVARCLAPDPAQRYQSASELQEDLRRQLDHLPLKHAADPSVRERARKWARRHPRLTSTTALAAFSVVLIAGVVAGYNERQRRFGPVEAAHALRGLADDHEAASVLLLDPGVDAARSEEGVAACRRALERFGVLESPAWIRSPLVRDLPARGQAELRGRVGDLLMLWARALARQAGGLDPDRRAELLGDALRRNARAELVLRPGRDALAPTGSSGRRPWHDLAHGDHRRR